MEDSDEEEIQLKVPSMNKEDAGPVGSGHRVAPSPTKPSSPRANEAAISAAIYHSKSASPTSTASKKGGDDDDFF